MADGNTGIDTAIECFEQCVRENVDTQDIGVSPGRHPVFDSADRRESPILDIYEVVPSGGSCQARRDQIEEMVVGWMVESTNTLTFRQRAVVAAEIDEKHERMIDAAQSAGCFTAGDARALNNAFDRFLRGWTVANRRATYMEGKAEYMDELAAVFG